MGRNKLSFTLTSSITRIQLEQEIIFKTIRLSYLRWKNTINDHERLSIKLNQYGQSRDIDSDGNERRYLSTVFLGPGTGSLTIYTSLPGDLDYYGENGLVYSERFLNFEVLLDSEIHPDVSPSNPVYVTLVFED